MALVDIQSIGHFNLSYELVHPHLLKTSGVGGCDLYNRSFRTWNNICSFESEINRFLSFDDLVIPSKKPQFPIYVAISFRIICIGYCDDFLSLIIYRCCRNFLSGSEDQWYLFQNLKEVISKLDNGLIPSFYRPFGKTNFASTWKTIPRHRVDL